MEWAPKCMNLPLNQDFVLGYWIFGGIIKVWCRILQGKLRSYSGNKKNIFRILQICTHHLLMRRTQLKRFPLGTPGCRVPIWRRFGNQGCVEVLYLRRQKNCWSYGPRPPKLATLPAWKIPGRHTTCHMSVWHFEAGTPKEWKSIPVETLGTCMSIFLRRPFFMLLSAYNPLILIAEALSESDPIPVPILRLTSPISTHISCVIMTRLKNPVILFNRHMMMVNKHCGSCPTHESPHFRRIIQSPKAKSHLRPRHCWSQDLRCWERPKWRCHRKLISCERLSDLSHKNGSAQDGWHQKLN